ncbi:MAG: META domain-containing protein [Chitinophagales bacterium]|nr:META domain-containing protein [Chitinophagales bacterium]
MRHAHLVLLPSLIILCFLSACNKEKIVDECPIDYAIDSSFNYTLVGKWRFVGFRDTSNGSMDHVLCGEVESFLNFTDSIHSVSGNPAYIYPYVLKGGALINSISGSYETFDTNGIRISKTVKSSVNGTQQVKDFEQRFYTLMESASRYRINYNELTLYPADGSVTMVFIPD